MKYMIITDVTDEMIENAQETSRDTLRYSTDGRVILKYKGSKPRCFTGITTYSHSQILEILEGSDWKNDDA